MPVKTNPKSIQLTELLRRNAIAREKKHAQELEMMRHDKSAKLARIIIVGLVIGFGILFVVG